MEKTILSDKDFHCIARQLQSAWRAPEQESIDTEGGDGRPWLMAKRQDA